MTQKKWANIKSFPEMFWPILAVIITVIVFIPSIKYDFLSAWDDSHYIGNQHLKMTMENIIYWLTAPVQKLYTPVTSYSFMIDHNLFGYNPVGYHAHNLLLHCGSILLLAAIMKQLRISPIIAGMITLLWAIHPQRVPSIVWISERKDVLVVFFALASFYTYIRACKKNKFSIAAPLFLLLSLGSKPAAIGLPAAMLIYTLWQHRKYKWPGIRLVIPSFLTLIIYLCWLFYIQSGQHAPSATQENFNLLQRIWIISHNLMWYLCSNFIPFQLNPLYPRISPFSLEYLPLIFGFIILSAIFYAMIFKTGKLYLKLKILLFISFVLCWGALFFPVSGIITIGMVDYADRYNYLPSIVIWLMLAMFISWQSQKRWARQINSHKTPLIAFLLIASCYWYISWSYMPAWNNSTSLFIRANEWQYPNPRSVDILGAVGIKKDNIKLLELASGKYLSMAAAGNKLPHYPSQIKTAPWLHSGLFLGAYALFLRGDYKGAFPVLLRLQKMAQDGSLRFYDKNGYMQKFWGTLANCYMHYRQTEKALRCLRNQLSIMKADPFGALFNKGLTAFLEKDFVSAEKYWKAASKIRPDDKKIIYNIKAAQKLQSQKINSSKISKKQ